MPSDKDAKESEAKADERVSARSADNAKKRRTKCCGREAIPWSGGAFGSYGCPVHGPNVEVEGGAGLDSDEILDDTSMRPFELNTPTGQFPGEEAPKGEDIKDPTQPEGRVLDNPEPPHISGTKSPGQKLADGTTLADRRELEDTGEDAGSGKTKVKRPEPTEEPATKADVKRAVGATAAPAKTTAPAKKTTAAKTNKK